jgi:hypothetical protein
MQKRTKIIAGAAAAAILAGGWTGVTLAGHNDGDGQPITGEALAKASAAALQEAGGGRVTGSEIHDQEGFYEVEVTLGSGKQVDVHLDKHFKVTDSGADKGADNNSDTGGG